MQYFLAAGFGAVILIVVSLTIVLIKIRKCRKELTRIQRTTEAENAPYESTLAISGGINLDHVYETIEEHDQGYQRLPASNLVGSVPRCSSESNNEGSYMEPNNADGSYLGAMDVTPANEYYDDVHPYLNFVNDTARINKHKVI
ncbi:uncharacterized protein LOC134258308 [Saccostrea cucullata]|uniref:uncharacterized protein LOC134258308 n=1 Tax=Saccostrea cuccullata TaxID=36930 RepID=UPI002ED5BD72